MTEAEAIAPSAVEHRPIRWVRTIALACTLAFVIDLVIGIAQSSTSAEAPDFVSFWAAGHLTARGQPAIAYDIATHNLVERMAAHVQGIIPFPYPPPFLFITAPLGFKPFWLSYACWVCAGSALYLFASRFWFPASRAWTHPAAHVNVLIGQTGLLTSSVCLLGLAQLGQRPLLAGAVLGLLVIKPQVFLLVPVALLAAREWKAIVGAIGSMFFLLGSALLAFGASTYAAFFKVLPVFGGLLQSGAWKWSELASVFALARWLGLPHAVAVAMQAIIALTATFIVWKAWRYDHPAKVPTLAAGTLLVPPYLFAYDTLLLILPIAWLVQTDRLKEAGVVWLLCVLSLLTYFAFYEGPNLMPVAALLSVWFLTRGRDDSNVSRRRESDGVERPSRNPHTLDLS